MLHLFKKGEAFMEQWDLFTEERLPTNQKINKGEKIEGKLCRQVVHIIIFNEHNDILIQKRQSFRKLWPNLWDLSVGGSVIAGESSKQAAQRETLEEIGLKLDFTNQRPFFTINFENGFDDFYLLKLEGVSINSLQLEFDEVADVKWASQIEIMQMLHNNEFIPYYDSFIPFLFECFKKRGLHKPQ